MLQDSHLLLVLFLDGLGRRSIGWSGSHLGPLVLLHFAHLSLDFLNTLCPSVLQKFTKVTLDLINVLFDGTQKLFFLFQACRSTGLSKRIRCDLVAFSLVRVIMVCCVNRYIIVLLSGLRSLTFSFRIHCKVILQLRGELVHKLVLDSVSIWYYLLASLSSATRSFSSSHGNWLHDQSLLDMSLLVCNLLLQSAGLLKGLLEKSFVALHRRLKFSDLLTLSQDFSCFLLRFILGLLSLVLILIDQSLGTLAAGTRCLNDVRGQRNIVLGEELV